MSAIITDQLRILNAENFVSAATSSVNSYYSFVGLPNATNYSATWESNPVAPKDCPVKDFVELIFGIFEPKTYLIASNSLTSPIGLLLPCVLI